MRRLMVLLAVLVAQASVAADVKVSVALVGSGKYYTGTAAYEVRATITNATKQDLNLAIMRCSWNSSFQVEPEDALEITGWDCDGNPPTSLELRPGAEAVFQFHVHTVARSRPPTRIRIGFEVERGPWVVWGWGRPWPGSDPKVFVEWSGWVELPPAGEKLLAESHESQVPGSN
jgi:hypothetical protein